MEALESTGNVVSHDGPRWDDNYLQSRFGKSLRLARIKVVCGDIGCTVPPGHQVMPGESQMLVFEHELPKIEKLVRDASQQRRIEAAKEAFEVTISRDLVSSNQVPARLSQREVHAVYEKVRKGEALSNDEHVVQREREKLYALTGKSWQAEFHVANLGEHIKPLLSLEVLEKGLRLPRHVEETRSSDATITSLVQELVKKEVASMSADKDARIAELEAQLEEATAPKGKSKG